MPTITIICMSTWAGIEPAAKSAVIPAKAGIPFRKGCRQIPACAGITIVALGTVQITMTFVPIRTLS